MASAAPGNCCRARARQQRPSPVEHDTAARGIGPRHGIAKIEATLRVVARPAQKGGDMLRVFRPVKQKQDRPARQRNHEHGS